MLIESRPATDPELAALVTAGQRELGGPATGGPPDAAYLVVAEGGRAVACGAWRPLPDGSAELTRLYVRPAHRGRGVARQLVTALEEEALAAGYRVVRLGPGGLPAALALCRAAGYGPAADAGAGRAGWAKTLVPAEPPTPASGRGPRCPDPRPA